MSVSLEQIIKSDAAYCRNVYVTVCRSLPSVTIHDGDGTQDDIFMQGGDADQFIQEFDSLIEQAPDVLFSEALKHLARQYVDCLWH